MIRRGIIAVVGVMAAANGIFMLAAGKTWYDGVPGVADSGPFNPHFVADIGAAFLVAGLALLARAWRSEYWPAAIAGAAFLGAHGFIHLLGLVGGHSHNPIFESLTVVLPSLLALWAAFPRKGESHA